ncbi:MAG: RNA polymerase sigma factor [Actinomycetota bacterium]
MEGEQELRDLVRRARSGDPDAWEVLYVRAYARLRSYARRRLPTADDAEEAVSETMMRAFDRIKAFTWRGAGFDAWMYGICRNVILEANRARGQSASAVSSLVPEQEPGPEDFLLNEEEARTVRAAFGQLHPEEQEVLELRVVGGLTAKEVGAVIGKRPGAVRMAQSRALDRLRSLMKGELT